MPDNKDGSLSEEEVQKIRDWIVRQDRAKDLSILWLWTVHFGRPPYFTNNFLWRRFNAFRCGSCISNVYGNMQQLFTYSHVQLNTCRTNAKRTASKRRGQGRFRCLIISQHKGQAFLFRQESGLSLKKTSKLTTLFPMKSLQC